MTAETLSARLAELESILDDPRQHLLVARDGDAIVGCVVLAKKGAGLAYLGMLTVDPQLQNRGRVQTQSF